ncbi:hypothetical protein [Stenotrophomonas maltophilia]|uniref:hypothetical protein n=1 Tax=Stenotrophomonas maltophilia TaxID=40324 RepID=UPI003BF78904
MADPGIYCFAGAKGLCMTQSEWAAWTQAALTCITFTVALITQHQTDRRSARQKRKSDAALMAERIRAADERRAQAENLLAKERAESLLIARATAIYIRPELGNFAAVLESIIEHGPPDSPAEHFNLALPNLAIRHRSLEALKIPEATDALLNVTNAAHALHNYLDACKDAEVLGPNEHKFISDLAKQSLPQVEAALTAVKAIAEGRAAPQN